jgi:hypothetical protein
MNEFKDFKKSKADLITSLKSAGSGTGKKKVKDMSLGSESGSMVKESRQNEIVMD